LWIPPTNQERIGTIP